MEGTGAITVAGLLALLAIGGSCFRAAAWIRNTVSTSSRAVHDRVNVVETELKAVRHEYVRRDDLDGHLRAMEKKLDDLGAQFSQIQQLLITRGNGR